MQTESPVESSAEQEIIEKSANILTAGEVLQQERKRLGLNEKEVADQLHITVHYVKALETNCYEKLPGAVFAKGYIKSYAILLGLDVEEILSLYTEFSHQQKSESEEATRLKARRKKDRNKPFVVVSLLVFVGGFLGLWLANSFLGEESAPVETSDTTPVASVDASNPAASSLEQQLTQQPQLSLQVEPEEPATIAPAAGQPATRQASTTGVPEATEPPTESESITGVASVQDIASAVIENTAQSSDLAGVPAQLPTLAQEPVVEAVPPAVADLVRLIEIDSIGDDILRISFSGESWVEVNDSDSQQIYRDIREAGDILEISGSAPFNVLLGDAPFIQMSLNGNEIDLSPNIRIDNSARLTVGL